MKNMDRFPANISFIANISNILMLILSVGSASIGLFAEKPFLIFLALIFIILFVIVKYHNNMKKRIALIPRVNLNISIAIFKFNIHLSKINSFNNKINKVERITNAFEKVLETSSIEIEKYFSTITNDNCSVTFKLNNKGLIRTLFRDPNSRQVRIESEIKFNGSKNIYGVELNTAFDKILNKGREFYVCDNLLRNKDYENCNNAWKELYNATLVVPISNGEFGENLQILGFICVDNFKGGFSKPERIKLLRSYGVMLYQVFSDFDKEVKKPTNIVCENELLEVVTNW